MELLPTLPQFWDKEKNEIKSFLRDWGSKSLHGEGQVKHPVVPDQAGRKAEGADSSSAPIWGWGRAAKRDQRELSAPKHYTGAKCHF